MNCDYYPFIMKSIMITPLITSGTAIYYNNYNISNPVINDNCRTDPLLRIIAESDMSSCLSYHRV